MLFKEISIDAKKELDPYFEMVDYEACEYCFTTLFMWQHVYKTHYHIDRDFAIIMAEYEGNAFSIMPLAKKENLLKAVVYAINYLKNSGSKIYFRGITSDVLALLKENYPEKFNYIEERDLFDYVYDAESLRTLSGKKNQKKRNHLNYFLKEYQGRYEYRLLNSSNFSECINLMETWAEIKEGNDEFEDGMDDESEGVKKIFENYDILKDKLKIAGVYIENKLQAFTIGELLNKDMALVHIEKANQDIRGLYQFINQQFILNEFPDVDFVNREEDLGIEGLRKAKLSYHPLRFVEKYSVNEI
ncbi:DUF2156 domain-containing protein [Proteocatella sphenisci]|uniref:DUF2156 domain-containing protein n=1 Tax=Proteocatella sphenisci TaxID=181070 RepID=UPI00048DF525|nr:phosphatidylglycerol lysyltransferase domain-containing protein [Proteocatella sphenisci]